MGSHLRKDIKIKNESYITCCSHQDLLVEGSLLRKTRELSAVNCGRNCNMEEHCRWWSFVQPDYIQGVTGYKTFDCLLWKSDDASLIQTPTTAIHSGKRPCPTPEE